MSSRARSYNDSATGAHSDVLTKKSQAPALYYTSPTEKTPKLVKFDGLENSNLLIDRKLAVVTTEKSKQQAMRQSLALEQNGLKGVWEVPNNSEAARAKKMFQELNIKNIGVRIINEPSSR